MDTNKAGKRLSAGVIARVGVLGAIAAILFRFPEIPVIGFYKLDMSNLPALLGGFALGPWAGLGIVTVKDLVGFLQSTSAGVGELADFLCSGIFVVTAGAVYARKKTFSGALTGMAVGIAAMTAVAALANYYLIIPFYISRMGLGEETIIGMIAAVIPAVDSIFKVIVFATVPFNLGKGVILCVLTLILYKRLSGILHGRG